MAPSDLFNKADKLLRENLGDRQILVTGNMVIDALFWVRDRILGDETLRYSLDTHYGSLDANKKLILVIGHRRENFGGGFELICAGLASIARRHTEAQILYPVHGFVK